MPVLRPAPLAFAMARAVAVLSLLALATSALHAGAQQAHEYLLQASHSSPDSFVPHGALQAHLVVVPACAAEGLARNVSFLFEAVEMEPPVPELQQALQRAHAWAAYAADGRLVRVGGLRGAPAEAREVVADVASQWQWMVPARVGAEAARRERDGAHTLRATYRHLGISRAGSIVLTKSRSFSSVVHDHHQRNGANVLGSQVNRAGRARLELSRDATVLRSLSANDTTSFWLELPEVMRAPGAGVEQHVVQSSLSVTLLTTRELTAEERAHLGELAGCEALARLLAHAEVEGMMRHEHVRTVGAEVPGSTVLLEGMWAPDARAHHVVPSPADMDHKYDILPEGFMTEAQRASMTLKHQHRERRVDGMPTTLLDLTSGAAAEAGKMKVGASGETFTAMMTAGAVVHRYLDSHVQTSTNINWVGNLMKAAATAMSEARALSEMTAVPPKERLQRLPTIVLDELLGFAAEGDDSFIMMTRYALNLLIVIRGASPSTEGLSTSRADFISELVELQRPIGMAWRDKFWGHLTLERVHMAMNGLVPALADTTASIAAVGDLLLTAAATSSDRDEVIDAAVKGMAGEPASLQSIQQMNSQLVVMLERVISNAREVQGMLGTVKNHGRDLLAAWESVLAGMTSLLDVSLISRHWSKSFGTERFLKATFVAEAEVSIKGSQAQKEADASRAAVIPREVATAAWASNVDSELMKELLQMQARLDSRLALDMAGFSQTGEVLALALEPKVSLAHGAYDLLPKLRLMNIELPLTLNPTALLPSLVKALVHKFVVSLLTSDDVQRRVVNRATGILKRSVQRSDNLIAQADPAAMSVQLAARQAADVLRAVALLDDAELAAMPAEQLRGSMAGRAYARLRATAKAVSALTGPVVSMLAQLTGVVTDPMPTDFVEPVLEQLRADIMAVSADAQARDVPMALMEVEAEMLLHDPHEEREGAFAWTRHVSFLEVEEGAAVGARANKEYVALQLEQAMNAVEQVSVREFQLALEALTPGAEVDAVTAKVVTAYCRLAAKDCELAAGPLTEAAAAALGGTFLHTEVVDKGLQLAVSLTKMLAMAGTAVAESVRPRDAREYLMRRAVFEHAHAAMAGAGAALAELAAVIPAERSPALAHAAPVAEFLRDKAAADFKNKHELVRCSVGMMDLVLQPVVRLVRRAHTAELGVCSMVNELTMPKREMDSSHCWGYLEGEAGPEPKITDPPPRTETEVLDAQYKRTMRRLYQGMSLLNMVLDLTITSCDVYTAVQKIVKRANGEGDQSERLIDIWQATYISLQHSLDAVTQAVQSAGMERNSAPMRVTLFIRKMVDKIDRLVRAIERGAGSPVALLERLCFQLVESLVVPAVMQSPVPQLVADQLYADIKERFQLTWLTAPVNSFSAMLDVVHDSVARMGQPPVAPTQLAVRNTDPGFFVLRFTQKMTPVAELVDEARLALRQWKEGDATFDLSTDKVRQALAFLLDMSKLGDKLAYTFANQQAAEGMVLTAIRHMRDELEGWSALSVHASVLPAFKQVLGMLGSAEEVAGCFAPDGEIIASEVRRLVQRGEPMLDAVASLVRTSLDLVTSVRGLFAATRQPMQARKQVAMKKPVLHMKAKMEALQELATAFTDAYAALGATPAVGAVDLSGAQGVLAAAGAEIDALHKHVECTVSYATYAYFRTAKALESSGEDAVCMNAGVLREMVTELPTRQCADYVRELPEGQLKTTLTTVLLGSEEEQSMLAYQATMVERVCAAVDKVTALQDALAGGAGSAAGAALLDKDLMLEEWGRNMADAKAAGEMVMTLARRFPTIGEEVATRLQAAMAMMDGGSALLGRTFSVFASTIKRLQRLAMLEPDTFLTCYAGRLPDRRTLKNKPLFNADLTIFSVTLRTLVFGVPVFLRLGIEANFHMNLESGMCEPLPAHAVIPQLQSPPPKLPYTAMAPVVGTALRVVVAVGVGVPFLSIGVQLRVDILALDLPIQTDVSLEHRALTVDVKPFLGAGGGDIKAQLSVLGFRYERRLYWWKGFRRQLASYCWNSHPDKFSSCAPRRARVHDAGARKPGNAIHRSDISHRCFLCAPAVMTVNWSPECPMLPERFNALAGMANPNTLLYKWGKAPWGDAGSLEAMVVCGERFAPDATGEWTYTALVRGRYLQAKNKPDAWVRLTVRQGKSTKYDAKYEQAVVQPSEVAPPLVAQAEQLLDSVTRAVTGPLSSPKARAVVNAYYEAPDAVMAVGADGQVEVVSYGADNPFLGAKSAPTGDDAHEADAESAHRFRRLRAGMARAQTLAANDGAVVAAAAAAAEPVLGDPVTDGTKQCFQCNVADGKLVCPRLGRRAALAQAVGVTADEVGTRCWAAAKAAKLAKESDLADYNKQNWLLVCDERVVNGALTGYLVVSHVPAIYMSYQLSSGGTCHVTDVSETINTPEAAPEQRAIVQLHQKFDEQKDAYHAYMGACRPQILVDTGMRNTQKFEGGFQRMPRYSQLFTDLEAALQVQTGSCYWCSHSSGKQLECAGSDRNRAERKTALLIHDVKEKAAFKPSDKLLSAVMASMAAANPRLKGMLSASGKTAVAVCDEFLGYNTRGEPSVVAGILCAHKGFDRVCYRYVTPWGVLANTAFTKTEQYVPHVDIREVDATAPNADPDSAHAFLFDKAVFEQVHDPESGKSYDSLHTLRETCINAPSGVSL